MSSIIEDVKVVIENISKTTDKEELDRLQKATQDYKILVDEGLSHPRGYNLRTIDNSFSFIGFNV